MFDLNREKVRTAHTMHIPGGVPIWMEWGCSWSPAGVYVTDSGITYGAHGGTQH